MRRLAIAVLLFSLVALPLGVPASAVVPRPVADGAARAVPNAPGRRSPPARRARSGRSTTRARPGSGTRRPTAARLSLRQRHLRPGHRSRARRRLQRHRVPAGDRRRHRGRQHDNVWRSTNGGVSWTKSTAQTNVERRRARPGRDGARTPGDLYSVGWGASNVVYLGGSKKHRAALAGRRRDMHRGRTRPPPAVASASPGPRPRSTSPTCRSIDSSGGRRQRARLLPGPLGVRPLLRHRRRHAVRGDGRTGGPNGTDVDTNFVADPAGPTGSGRPTSAVLSFVRSSDGWSRGVRLHAGQRDDGFGNQSRALRHSYAGGTVLAVGDDGDDRAVGRRHRLLLQPRRPAPNERARLAVPSTSTTARTPRSGRRRGVGVVSDRADLSRTSWRRPRPSRGPDARARRGRRSRRPTPANARAQRGRLRHRPGAASLDRHRHPRSHRQPGRDHLPEAPAPTRSRSRSRTTPAGGHRDMVGERAGAGRLPGRPRPCPADRRRRLGHARRAPRAAGRRTPRSRRRSRSSP